MARRGNGLRGLINVIAFVALMLIGAALTLTLFNIGSDLQSAFITIANVLAYITVAFCAFFWAQGTRRRTILWLILWAVAVVLIVLHFIL
ncbi:MAG: hypothetical protein FWE16_04545 [Firmicutes bacterium]|nr:hypothetical protein [Bacillota bacterium]